MSAKPQWKTVKAEVLVDADGWVRAICLKDPARGHFDEPLYTVVGMIGTGKPLTDVLVGKSPTKAKQAAERTLHREGFIE